MRTLLHSSIRSITIGIFLTILFVIVNSMSVWAQCDRPLINGWIGAWEPFILGTPDNPSGLDVEILEAIVAKAGCTLQHTKETPWNRHLALIESGKIDLATS
ncbi:MAG: amino acid ABC transporter substrate-binding protein, partial [Desulfobacteraceae bacterium]|nr:amino acid ABC transporter substrate-binding protein [Desulfobacteraceae bacterium]